LSRLIRHFRHQRGDLRAETQPGPEPVQRLLERGVATGLAGPRSGDRPAQPDRRPLRSRPRSQADAVEAPVVVDAGADAAASPRNFTGVESSSDETNPNVRHRNLKAFFAS